MKPKEFLKKRGYQPGQRLSLKEVESCLNEYINIYSQTLNSSSIEELPTDYKVDKDLLRKALDQNHISLKDYVKQINE